MTQFLQRALSTWDDDGGSRQFAGPAAGAIEYRTGPDPACVSLLVDRDRSRVVGPTKQIFGHDFSMGTAPRRLLSPFDALRIARGLASDLKADLIVVDPNGLLNSEADAP